jgi:ectoine hydroxylase-related dioxygenase (phytanoyl-CoA dioxygenase family)
MKLTEETYGHSFAALAETVEHILAHEESLRSFVHQVDAEWGRIYLERPHFQRPGQPPHRDDPYTFASVRATLSTLLETLRASEA